MMQTLDLPPRSHLFFCQPEQVYTTKKTHTITTYYTFPQVLAENHLICAQSDWNVFHICTELRRFCQPVTQNIEGVSRGDIEHEKNPLRVLVKLIADLKKRLVTREIPEVDSNLPARYLHGFDAVVHTDGGDVLRDEALLAIPKGRVAMRSDRPLQSQFARI